MENDFITQLVGQSVTRKISYNSPFQFRLTLPFNWALAFGLAKGRLVELRLLPNGFELFTHPEWIDNPPQSKKEDAKLKRFTFDISFDDHQQAGFSTKTAIVDNNTQIWISIPSAFSRALKFVRREPIRITVTPTGFRIIKLETVTHDTQKTETQPKTDN